jgi:hypothetical protein
MAEIKLNKLKKRFLPEKRAVRKVTKPRFSFLLITFFAGFVLMVIGGLVLPKFRDTLLRTADFFGGGEVIVHSAANAAGAPFLDVPASDPAARALWYLKSGGVLEGYPDGTFRPAETLTRAALISLIGKVNNSNPQPYFNSDCFKDVGTEPYARFVCSAKRNGWVTGYSGNLFKPDNEVSKAEALKITMTVFGFKPVSSEISFENFREILWYQPYLDFAREKKWLWSGFDVLRIDEPITRVEAAELLYNIISSGGALK